MRKSATLAIGLSLTLSLSLITHMAIAQELMIYASDGQTGDQQEMDEFQCFIWARDQSGFDPMAVPTASTPPPQQGAQQGGVGRGAVGGAAVGLALGRSDGAVKGAAAGALIGGMRRNRQNREQEQAQANWEQQQTAQYQNNRNSYNRAFAACLEGRGYTVR